MRRAILASPLDVSLQLSPNDHSPVSALSEFSDETWDFSTEMADTTKQFSKRSIQWRFKLTEERDSLATEYAIMLLALKQLTYSLLFSTPRMKPISVIDRIVKLKVFVRFLAERPSPIFRFQDVLEFHFKEYIDYLKTRPGRHRHGAIYSSVLCHHLAALNLLHDRRDQLGDYLTFRPTGDRTPSKIAGYRYAEARENRTQPIPDQELKALIEAALNYLQHRAPIIFNCLEKFYRFAEDFKLGFPDRRLRSHICEKDFFAGREDLRSIVDLNDELIHLRSACFIIIAFSTGMRISEILAMQHGCVRQESTSNHGTFYWINSKLFKTQRKDGGSFRSWMCGPLAAQAVEILEKCGCLIRTYPRISYLFVGFNIVNDPRSADVKNKALAPMTITDKLRKFCKVHGVTTHLHAHRLRRSFARNIIRFSSTSILALKDHFKHWSLYMTDWYVGLDPELLEDLEAERLLLSIEAAEKICTEKVGGTGGRRWTQELDQRIREGRLPRNFRGKAGAEFRKKMIQGLHDSGMIVVPCGNFTYCVFEKELALCTKGERPMVNRCHPVECANSFILIEHVPAYRQKLASLEAMYANLAEDAKRSPDGLLYSEEIRKIRQALEPFTNQ
jgi:integrase